VRAGSKAAVGNTLQNNGNEIFNSGGYGGSQKYLLIFLKFELGPLEDP
jgi:hypothetical protein